MTDETIQEFANKILLMVQQIDTLEDMLATMDDRLEAIEKVME